MSADASALLEVPPWSTKGQPDADHIDMLHPDVRLSGAVNEDMLKGFRDQIASCADGPRPMLIELTTTGGDADVGRQIADDIRLIRETGRRLVFLGKTTVYSAGMTIMAAFDRTDRCLVKGTMLLVHGRAFTRTLNLDGPLAVEKSRVTALLAEIDAGLALEKQGFSHLIAGSDIALAEVIERARSSWYLSAAEALDRRLVGKVI
jgi:hypothetical protein